MRKVNLPKLGQPSVAALLWGLRIFATPRKRASPSISQSPPSIKRKRNLNLRTSRPTRTHRLTSDARPHISRTILLPSPDGVGLQRVRKNNIRESRTTAP
ncbi:hypothetical protein GW17_00055355 [Ensete ventricosum]|nr:hypothetical protein GW17_00055355 [Ensete ventricosum]